MQSLARLSRLSRLSRLAVVSPRGLHTVSPIFSAPLEPLFSLKGREILRNRYQQKYLDDLNTLTSGTPLENHHLEMLVKETAKNPKYAAIFNNAAQAWNNEFFLHMLTSKPTKPSAHVEKRLNVEFGGVEEFKTQFNDKAMALFGNGWVWLVEDNKHRLKIMTYFNAGCPLVPERLHPIDRNVTGVPEGQEEDLDFIHSQGADYHAAKKELLSTLGFGLAAGKPRKADPNTMQLTPVLCVNLWEHCYFTDYQNNREAYLAKFWEMVNWDLVHQYIGNWKHPLSQH